MMFNHFERGHRGSAELALLHQFTIFARPRLHQLSLATVLQGRKRDGAKAAARTKLRKGAQWQWC